MGTPPECTLSLCWKMRNLGAGAGDLGLLTPEELLRQLPHQKGRRLVKEAGVHPKVLEMASPFSTQHQGFPLPLIFTLVVS